MPIDLLVLIELVPERLQKLEAAGFIPHPALTAAELAGVVQRVGPRIRAILTNGSTGVSGAVMDMFPAAEMACALGVGYENIDLERARARNMVVSNGAGANHGSVADHAMALLMAVTRDIVVLDAAVRRGQWKSMRPVRPMISGKRLGILGLGGIGLEIARRAIGGFGMTVAYHNRRPRDNINFSYFPTVAELAEWADFLMIATPGGKATAKLVDATVLEALGPHGFLVNIARGSVVDTAALIAALRTGQIAGAALDVVAGEPDVPPELFGLEKLIMTPHTAGRSPESIKATLDLAIANLTAHFNGQPVLTPIPP